MRPRPPAMPGTPTGTFAPLRFAAYVAAVATVGSFAAPATALAQQAADLDDTASRAAEIVDTAREKRYERWEGVDDYTVYGTFRGADVAHYYEKMTVDGRPTFRLVPPHEYEGDELEQAGLSNGFPTAAGNRGGAPGVPPAGGSGGAADALPSGDLPGTDDLPVPDGVQSAADRLGEARDAITNNPIGRAASGLASGDLQRNAMQSGMQGLMGGMQDDGTGEAMASARTEAMMYEALRQEGRFAGTESVEGRETYVLVADDLTRVDLGAAAGEETNIRLRSAKIWLDAEEYVPLKTEMVMIGGGGGQPMTIEVHNRDYRRVDGLYESFDRTIRTEGALGMLGGGSEMQERMRQGMEQMEQMKERMEDMPPAQRRMFEQQMEQMGGMAGGGGMDGMTIEMATEEIVVNDGPPRKHGRGSVHVSGGAAAKVSRTIATIASGPHPGGDGTLTMLQLIGGADTEANEAAAVLQLNLAGELPEPGSTSGQGALILQWDDGRQGNFQSDDVVINVTSRTSRHLRGEYSMEADGFVSDGATASPDPTTITVRGTFEAALPRSARPGPAGVRPREAPMAPGGGYMQP